MAKKQRDIKKVATKIMAIFLALLMFLGIGGTLIYYLIAM